ncbi:MAG: DUF4442 domain-containing protein [Caulobacteraceae bacterium]|nr:DUF4442 domain-containing protein [Caulobacter sp.]
MAESLRTRLLRWRFNLHPAYRRSGARLTYVAADLREVRVRLPLCRATRNLNGTIYGGSIYAAVDPLHAVMLAQLLGPREYVAWTKAAHVRFLRQARTDLEARVLLSDEEVREVRAEIARAGKVERRYTVELTDTHGHVCAACEITVHLHARENRAQTASAAGPLAAPAAS